MINIIYSMNKRRFIGKKEKLMYNFKKDMEYFKGKTMNNTLVFGYRSFMEIGKPLPNREIIVIVNKDRDFKKIEGIHYVFSLDEAIEFYKNNPFGDLFICGGKTIYDQVFSKYMDKINFVYETLIDSFEYGDVSINRIIPNYFYIIKEEKELDLDRNSNKIYNLYFRTFKNKKLKHSEN